jgi:hypothetical protein
MITVEEVKTKKQQREFLNFPTRLYKGNSCFVPPLYLDEKKIFDKDYIYLETCEAVYFNAYKDGVMAGRISGILQKASNEKTGERRVRFIRFDTIEDFEVAKALFGAVEKWALAKGMDTVCGPLGFSDLEREGLLIDGFDQMSTFEEQYNAPYYQDFIERLGYAKEVDWLEYRIFSPDPEQEAEMHKMSDFLLRRYKLRIGPSKNATDFLNRYKDGFFEILDKSYENIYGTVPFTDKMKELMMDNFKLIIDEKHAVVILDENDKVVLMGICFPSIAKAMQKAGGHLSPAAVLEYLKVRRRPEVIDLGLIGVDPAWMNRGISIVVASELAKMLHQEGTLYAESNLNLEDNYAIQNLWKRFNAIQHKRRRSFIKKLSDG